MGHTKEELEMIRKYEEYIMVCDLRNGLCSAGEFRQ